MTGITVYCDDSSHDRWDIGVYQRHDGVWRPDEALKRAAATLHYLGETYGSDRWRYRFECVSCGIVLPVRGEKMMPVFDGLAAAGQPEISLRGVRRVTT